MGDVYNDISVEQFIDNIESVMKEYKDFETYNEEEYLNSPHSATRRKKGQVTAKPNIVRTLYPAGNAMITIYVMSNKVKICTSLCDFKIFENAELSESEVFNTNGKRYFVKGTSYSQIYQKTEKLVREMFEFLYKTKYRNGVY